MKKGFSLTEILIACVLMSLIVLAVASVDITSRRFFASAERQSRVQDEAKIAMEHIIRNVQRGIGDMTQAEVADDTTLPGSNNSRGFYILNDSGKLSTSGLRIRVKLDDDGDGRYIAANDKIVEYRYNANNHTIEYRDPYTAVDPEENLAAGMVVQDLIFSFNAATPNRVDVEITVRRDPEQDPSLENPETTLTSSIVLRAMSTN